MRRGRKSWGSMQQIDRRASAEQSMERRRYAPTPMRKARRTKPMPACATTIVLRAPPRRRTEPRRRRVLSLAAARADGAEMAWRGRSERTKPWLACLLWGLGAARLNCSRLELDSTTASRLFLYGEPNPGPRAYRRWTRGRDLQTGKEFRVRRHVTSSYKSRGLLIISFPS